MPTITKQIAAGVDDCYEVSTGTFNDTNTVLGVGASSTALLTCGVRFDLLGVPDGAEIVYAELRLRKSGFTGSGSWNMVVRGVDLDTALVWRTLASTRPRQQTSLTDASAIKAVSSLDAGGALYALDVTDLVAEVASRPGWDGETLAFVVDSDDAVTGSDHYLTLHSYEAGSNLPELYVEYSIGTPVFINHDSRALIDTARSLGHDTAASASTSIEALQDTRFAIAKTVEALHDTETLIQAGMIIVRQDTSLQITSLLLQVHDTRARIGGEVGTVHDTHARIGSAVETVHDTRARVATELGLLHDASASVSSLLSVRQDTRVMTPATVFEYGGASVDFIWPPERPGSHRVDLFQTRERDSGGEVYVYDKGAGSISHLLVFSRVDDGTLAALRAFISNIVLGQRHPFIWRDNSGAARIVRLTSRLLRHRQTAPGRHRVEIALEEEL